MNKTVPYTEDAYESLIHGVNLSDEEKYIIRKDVGLPVGDRPTLLPDGNTEMEKAMIRSVRMRAWAKFGDAPGKEQKGGEQKPQNGELVIPKENDPVVVELLQQLDEVGLNHSCVMGGSAILEGGVSDVMKAFRLPEFRNTLGGGNDMASRATCQQNIRPALRVLAAHVAKNLQEKGAVLTKKELCHNDTVDEVYEFEFKGKSIGFILMPN
jgi:hypothetical protein